MKKLFKDINSKEERRKKFNSKLISYNNFSL